MLAKTFAGGLTFAFPDVCLTPMPPAPVPPPIPWPNMAMNPMNVGFVPNLFLTCTPVHNLTTTAPLTLGDNAGIAGGIISHTDMATERNVTAAFTVIAGWAPMTRLTSISIHNTINAIGATIVPSVTNVLVLAA